MSPEQDKQGTAQITGDYQSHINILIDGLERVPQEAELSEEMKREVEVLEAWVFASKDPKNLSYMIVNLASFARTSNYIKGKIIYNWLPSKFLNSDESTIEKCICELSELPEEVSKSIPAGILVALDGMESNRRDIFMQNIFKRWQESEVYGEMKKTGSSLILESILMCSGCYSNLSTITSIQETILNIYDKYGIGNAKNRNDFFKNTDIGNILVSVIQSADNLKKQKGEEFLKWYDILCEKLIKRVLARPKGLEEITSD